MNPLKISNQTYQEATDILEQTKVIDHLSKFGDVRVGGSYFTDLMYGPDIDITLASDNPKKSAVDFLAKMIKQQSFQKYQYGDFESFPRTNRPKDHIVVLILPFNNRKWEIEVWFVKNHFEKQIDLETKLKQLPQDKKNEIIQLKHQREVSGTDKHKLSSFDIYQKFI